MLIGILLWEGNDDGAWQAIQNAQPDELPDELDELPDDLWLEVANRRAKKHPQDALAAYRRLVTRYAGRKNRYSYELAIKTLRRLGLLMKKQKQQHEFLLYVETLCSEHRHQHAFVKTLRQVAARHSSRTPKSKNQEV